MKHYYDLVRQDPVWSRVISFSFILFIIRIADGVISFWAPNLIEDTLKSAVAMGLIISFQSIVGFVVDLVFPSLLKGQTVRRMIFLSLIAIAVTSLTLFGASYKPLILLFLLSMTLWGLYYELINFANYEFVGSTVPLHMRAASWGIMNIFKNLAYFLGPLVGAWLLFQGEITTLIFILLLLGIALSVYFSRKTSQVGPIEMDIRQVNPMTELKHWLTLTEHVWPAITMSLILGFIDATFWTTGAVWTEKLASSSSWGGLFLPFYMLPPLFVGFLIAKKGIYRGKKVLADKFILVAGIFLTALALSGSIVWQLSMVFLAALALSVSYPLLDGVYSDLAARMGKEKKHVIGLTSSIVNLSYIIWPSVAGVITSYVGERMTFSVVGILSAITASVLMLVIPKKIRLPETEIHSWTD
jgi:MFS family permease